MSPCSCLEFSFKHGGCLPVCAGTVSGAHSSQHFRLCVGRVCNRTCCFQANLPTPSKALPQVDNGDCSLLHEVQVGRGQGAEASVYSCLGRLVAVAECAMQSIKGIVNSHLPIPCMLWTCLTPPHLCRSSS